MAAVNVPCSGSNGLFLTHAGDVVAFAQGARLPIDLVTDELWWIPPGCSGYTQSPSQARRAFSRCDTCSKLLDTMRCIALDRQLGWRAVLDVRIAPRSQQTRVVNADFRPFTGIGEVREAFDRDILRMVKESVCLLGDGSEFSTHLFGRTDTSLGNMDGEYNDLRTSLFAHNRSFKPLCNFADCECNAHKEAVHGLVLQSLHGSIERLKEESEKQGGTGFVASDGHVKWGQSFCLASRYAFEHLKRLIARRQAGGAQAAGAQPGAADGNLTLIGFCAVASRFKPKPGDTNSIEHLISNAVRASGFNAQGQDAFDGFSMARFSGQDIEFEDTVYRFRPTDNARQRLQKLLALQAKLATAYQATSHMADTKAQHIRRVELDLIYGTALAQVFYTQQWPALPPGGEPEEAPGLFQHHAYYWIMIKKEQLKSCFPQTYDLYYPK